METHKEILVSDEESGKRLDIVLAAHLTEYGSRSQIQKWIRGGKVQINGTNAAPSRRLQSGEKISIEIVPQILDETCAEDIPLNIIYDDAEVVLVNKPSGMVVHPAHGNREHTLVNALLFHFKKLSKGGGAPARPGIVHRLDKDTSGVLVVAKNDRAHAFLANQFKRHSIERMYLAVVQGIVQHDEGFCEEPVGRTFLNRKKIMIKPSGGKEALTFFRVRKRFKKATLLEVFPKTGRTHQIRVHLAHLGHPVLGDSFYGVTSPWIKRQALHAFSLGFIHPVTKKRCYGESPIPVDMKVLITYLESEK
ncbi:MAG: RluA family pseudouridine synthase [Candidatus Omnitrophica bacterium]|nr:RluA family pseudouridine synthase [Candidatus Omnitrophota bacterium]